MKKYMKPIMESESFVANEYVAVCSIIQCLNSDCNASEVVTKLPNEITSGLTPMGASGVYMYRGALGGVDNCSNTKTDPDKPDWIEGISEGWIKVWLGGWIAGQVEKGVWEWYQGRYGNGAEEIEYHPVSVKLKGKSNGSNAS